ncbi:MAG: FAD-dependent oxidoreductase [Ardenticatenaceae bacterium]
MDSKIVFPNYLQMKRVIPINVWHAIRVLSVGFALGLILILFVNPEIGLKIFWGVIIPTVPLLFFIAPGVWRNICPMAALNQTPRIFNFTRRLTAPKWFQEYGYVIAIALFLIIVPNRQVIFTNNDPVDPWAGPALALLMIALYSTAFVMGVFFKGKSGWCSSICPLLPVQRIYGQTPFIKVANSHCQPSTPEPGGCVGCTKNCYDFRPDIAYLADLNEKDEYFSGYRKFFVGLFPGFIYAFYTLLELPQMGVLERYLWFAVYSLASAGSFYLLDSFLKVTANKITVLYGAAALNIYYWNNSVTLSNLFPEMVAPGLAWALWGVVFALSLVWIYNTYKKEEVFVEQIIGSSSIQVASNDSIVAHHSSQIGNPEVTFEPDGKRIVVEKGRTVLEVAESNGLPIEPGCRMGVCGADPICVVKGMENLSKMSDQERQTVERLNLGKNGRMACVARIKGPVKVSLSCDEPAEFASSIVEGFKYDKSVNDVVIIGNGIAGVTAADHVRRRHPLCKIHLIGRESHHLYNRMGITRLIYGRSAMEGLYLMPEKWYKDLKITTWLNTQVTAIDPRKREVKLGTGDSLSYDRLILTTGSQAYVPPIEGYGMAGSFALREAADAMEIRSFVQKHRCRQGVVAGGGLLGLEAAYGLHKLGMKVSVLERSGSLLRRQLDARGGEFLREYLEGLGITIVMKAETASVQGRRRLRQVTLKDGRTLPADTFLVCAGIRSETQLGGKIGLKVKRGIVVDQHMRTNIPNIFVAGDAAEFNGKVFGLWTVAVSQAEVAAANAVSNQGQETETYKEIVPVTMLKVAGIDLTSIGRFNPDSKQEEVIALEDIANQRYRKLVIAKGKIAGAILLGYPRDAPGVTEAIKTGFNVTPYLNDLRAGDWKVLADLAS